MAQKDEFEQNAIISFGMAKALLENNNEQMENCFKYLCFEMITPDILNYNNDVFLQRAFLVGNARAIQIWRNEVLSNPVDLIPNEVYPVMLLSIYTGIDELNKEGSKLNMLVQNLPDNEDLQEQLAIVKKLIWAQYLKHKDDSQF